METLSPNGAEPYFEAVDAFLGSKKSDGTNCFSPNTQVHYGAMLKSYARFRERQQAALDPDAAFRDVESLKGFLSLSAQVGLAYRTVADRAKCLRAISYFVAGDDSVSKELKVKPKEEGLRKRRPAGAVLTPARIENIVNLAHTEADLRVEALFGLLSDGLSPTQASRLQRRDLQVRDGQLMAFATMRSRVRWVPISHRTEAVLDRYLASLPLGDEDRSELVFHSFSNAKNNQKGGILTPNAAFDIARFYELKATNGNGANLHNDKEGDPQIASDFWDKRVFPLTKTQLMQDVIFPALRTLTGEGPFFVMEGSSQRFREKEAPHDLAYEVLMPTRLPNGKWDLSLRIEVCSASDKEKLARLQITKDGIVTVFSRDGKELFKSKPNEELTRELIEEKIKAALA